MLPEMPKRVAPVMFCDAVGASSILLLFTTYLEGVRPWPLRVAFSRAASLPRSVDTAHSRRESQIL